MSKPEADTEEETNPENIISMKGVVQNMIHQQDLEEQLHQKL